MPSQTSLLEITEEKQSLQEQGGELFLQIHRIKLGDYVSLGLIAPDKYLNDERETDVQSKTPNMLALSRGCIEKLDEGQVLIEIIFTESEKERLKHFGDVYFYDMPLPLSRIKKIYVQDNKIKKHILKILETGDVGFLPERLFDTFKKRTFTQYNYTIPSEVESTNDFAKQIRCYDGRMGMFSFMKNIGFYYNNETESVSNYSNGYILALSALLNQPIEKKPLYFLNLLKEHEEFKEFLYSNQIMEKDFIKKEIEKTEDTDIKEVFSQLLLPNKTIKTLQKLAQKKAWYHYSIALIYRFRQKDSNKKDNFKVDVATFIPREIAETAFAILGIYLGYRNLRASEAVEFQDRYFKKIFGSKLSIKNELTTKLDYVLMESIYQTCFYEIKKIDIPTYLDYPKSIEKLPLPKDKKFKTYYKVETNDFLDTNIVKITKRSAMEIIVEKLEKYPDKIVFGKAYLASFINKYFISLIQYSENGVPCKPFCSKNSFIEAIKQKHEIDHLDELLSVFEIDRK